MSDIDIKTTQRGFSRGEFVDLYGSQCSIQESSLATENTIWLGVDRDFQGRKCTQMHLTRGMVENLLPHLQKFVNEGDI